MNKINYYLIFVLIYIIFFRLKKEDINILGFQIMGIGNGHITQAKVIYNALIKKYDIPIVIIYGREYGFDNIFSKSLVIYKGIKSSNDSINNMKILPSLIDFFSSRNNFCYEQKYKINKWFNFWVPDLYNFRTKQILIAPQLACNHYVILIIVIFIKFFGNIKLVSVHLKSRYTDYILPPLIDNNEINRTNVDKKFILAYSVSGLKFVNTLSIIAKRNPEYTFHYYTKSKILIDLPSNIEIFLPDINTFKEKQKIAGAILCTSGNELILESVYNSIPVATMPCSKSQFEQVFNFNKYVNKLDYASEMNENLDLKYLVDKNVKDSQDNLKLSFKNRDQKILNLCNI